MMKPPQTAVKLWGRSEKALLALFMVFICSLSIHLIYDNDVFSHIKTGEYIVKTGSIPQTDIFSYTIEGRPWTDNQWLAQVLYYFIYKVFNLNGLILFKTLIICAVFLIMFFSFSFRRDYFWGYILLGILAAIASYGRYIIRPENFTLLFCAAYMHIFTRRRLLWLVPFIQAFWVNMHGGFILGLVLTALFCIGEILEDRHAGPRAQKALILLTVAVSACFVNPYGFKLIVYPFQFIGNKFLQGNILEWRPSFQAVSLDKIDSLGAFILLNGLSVICLMFNFKKIRPFFFISVAAFLYLGIQSCRNMPLSSVVSFVALCTAITHFADEAPEKIKSFTARIRPAAGICAAFLLCFLIFDIATNRYFRRIRVPIDFGLGIASALQPIGSCDFIRHNRPEGKLFNDYDFGAYCIYSLYPDYKVFIDGRIDTYGSHFYHNEFGVFWGNDPTRIKGLIDKYNIKIFLLKHGKEQPLMAYLLAKEGCRLVHFDEAGLLLIKDDSSRNKAIIDKFGIDISALKEAVDYSLPQASGKDLGWNGLERLFRNVSGARHFPMAEYNLGNFYSNLGALNLARMEFEKGIVLFPEYKDMRYCLGNLYYRNGLFDKAIEAYSQVLNYDSRDWRVYNVLGELWLRKGDSGRSAQEFKKAKRFSGAAQ